MADFLEDPIKREAPSSVRQWNLTPTKTHFDERKKNTLW